MLSAQLCRRPLTNEDAKAASCSPVAMVMHQLQLQLLSGGLFAEAAGSVVDGLEVSVSAPKLGRSVSS